MQVYRQALAGTAVQCDRTALAVLQTHASGNETDAKMSALHPAFPHQLALGFQLLRCHADAAVVGTYFKENGKLENEKLENVRVDAHRVREFMAVVKALREQK